MQFQRAIAAGATILLVSACAQNPSQNNYPDKDVGQNTTIEYGKVKSQRVVDVTSTDNSAGTLAGAGAGGLGGAAIGSGKGSLLGLLGGAILGGITGNVAEGSLKDRQGIEYIIKFYKTGETRSIVQNIAKTDTPIANGICVMVQKNGTYQRVLPAPPGDEDCAEPLPK